MEKWMKEEILKEEEDLEEELVDKPAWVIFRDCKKRAAQAKFSECKEPRQRKNTMVYTYNITLEEYEKMLKDQGGVCRICGGLSNNKNLAIDHNHKTGEVRGLLCTNCNMGLGNMKDNPLILIRTVHYLRGFLNE